MPFTDWLQELFQNTSEQGSQYDSPLSESNEYLAFLSKEDFDPDESTYDILFEVVPFQWAVKVLAVSRSVFWPNSVPASLFHMHGVNKDALIEMLRIGTADNLAEGSWYVLRLEKGSDGLRGTLYDPDIDMRV